MTSNTLNPKKTAKNFLFRVKVEFENSIFLSKRQNPESVSRHSSMFFVASMIFFCTYSLKVESSDSLFLQTSFKMTFWLTSTILFTTLEIMSVVEHIDLNMVYRYPSNAGLVDLDCLFRLFVDLLVSCFFDLAILKNYKF